MGATLSQGNHVACNRAGVVFRVFHEAAVTTLQVWRHFFGFSEVAEKASSPVPAASSAIITGILGIFAKSVAKLAKWWDETRETQPRAPRAIRHRRGWHAWGDLQMEPAAHTAHRTRYSVRSAITGSFFAAMRLGINPAISESATEMSTSTTPAPAGTAAKFSTPATW